MAVTVTTFLRDYPEFSNASPDLIRRKVALASSFVSTAVFGDKLDDAVKLRAAHLLSISPPGEEAKSEPGETFYWAEFMRLVKVVTSGKGRVS